MSLPSAMTFLRVSRTSQDLQQNLAKLPEAATSNQLSACFTGASFTDEELNAAFRMDWMARWLHYSKD